MSYTKQTWATGDTITAEKLNHMEDGIVQGGGVTIVTISVNYDEQTEEETYTADKTYAELSAIIENGGYVVAYEAVDDYRSYYYMRSYSIPSDGMEGFIVFATVDSTPSNISVGYLSIDSNNDVAKTTG